MPPPPTPQVVLSMLHSRLGNGWSDIVATQCLPGRSQNDIKNKWWAWRTVSQSTPWSRCSPFIP